MLSVETRAGAPALSFAITPCGCATTRRARPLRPFRLRRPPPRRACRVGWAVAASCAAWLAAPHGAFAAPVSSAYASAEEGVPHSTRLYWGDLHLHTHYSVDAAMFGNHRVGPDEAYRFAKGETVMTSLGKPARLETPLDFLAVADHAESMATIWQLRHPSDEQKRSPGLQSILRVVREGVSAIPAGIDMLSAVIPAFIGAEVRQMAGNTDAAWSTWRAILASAERHNAPGRFTALIGYEWSSAPKGDNLHRVVVYRDGADKAGMALPISARAADTDPTEAFSADTDPIETHPETLWAGLRAWEKLSGGQALAIPHNSNLSGGRMFRPRASSGPMSAAYARERARWEPVVEVTQISGDSEAHPLLSPADEFADYEVWNTNLLNTRQHRPDDVKGDYVREALKVGLSLRRPLGVNPFRFGMIGSADSHTGLVATTADNFWGKASMNAPRPGRMQGHWARAGEGPSKLTIANTAMAASGYAAVWASENTREGIFDALRRREVYASTGPRITVRFFGGFGFADGDVDRVGFAAIGYRAGVPMGGVLGKAPDNKGPSFMVSALKDPLGANLDRVQIIKGWLDRSGQRQERVYDVAVSGDRRIGRDGRARKPVGNTVDEKTASYRNTIGAAALSVQWRDPHFRRGEDAFYYVRVLEIPTPRWTTYDAVHFDEALPEGVPATTQERVYTSPIWYQP